MASSRYKLGHFIAKTLNVPCKNERCHSNQISNLLRHIMIGLTSLCDELLSEIKIECLKKD